MYLNKQTTKVRQITQKKNTQFETRTEQNKKMDENNLLK